jgi:hypothetical protein
MDAATIAALQAFAAEAYAALGEELVSLAGFGSRVRGNARLGSDLDVLVVARSWPVGITARVAVLDRACAAGEVALRAQDPEAWIQVVPRTPEEVLRGGPLYYDMTIPGEVLVLRDEGGFLGLYLRDLHSRMKALGAVRHGFGRHAYWDLKPDWRPGDVIDL